MQPGYLILIALVCTCLIVYTACHWQKWFGTGEDSDNDDSDETNFG